MICFPQHLQLLPLSAGGRRLRFAKAILVIALLGLLELAKLADLFMYQLRCENVISTSCQGRDFQEFASLTFFSLSTPPLPSQSLLLNQEDGCAIFRQFVEKLSAGDGSCSPASCLFREKATTLLFLERDAFRHYPENSCQVRYV